MSNQQTQLETLHRWSGVDFKFVQTNENKFGLRYYEHKCKSDDEYQSIAERFNDYNFCNADGFIYRCLEHDDHTCSIIVLENELDTKKYDNITMYNRITDLSELQPIGKLGENDVFLEPILTSDGKYSTIVERGLRAIAVVNINGRRLPFYISSGKSGKEQEFGIPSGKWYPLQGISSGWLNKMPDMLHTPYPELDTVCNILEQKFPAIKLKHDALNGKLPKANANDLLKIANFEFPEGVSFSEYGGYSLVKNHCVYLPQIITAWRSKPNDFLNVRKGILAVPGQEILNKIQEMRLFCGSMIDGDCIWFYPIDDSEYIASAGFDNNLGIESALYKLGIDYQIIEKSGRKGFGVPISCFVDYFSRQKREKYERASEQFTKFQTEPSNPNDNFAPIIKRIGDIFRS